MSEWRKAIPEPRDRLQSKLLVWTVTPVLLLPNLVCIVLATHPYNAGRWCLRAFGVSLTFGVLVWALRAATFGGVLCGSMICLLLLVASERRYEWHSALIPLIFLFLLTFAATKAGKARKARLGLAESRRGRNAAQVLANLGVAGVLPVAAYFRFFDTHRNISPAVDLSAIATPTLILAALCEATADTVSSEIGQAFGGRPFLLTTLRRVEPGADGAITPLGTAAGIFAAAIVAAVGMASMSLDLHQATIALTGGIAGLFFDSFLGATVERKGWLGNDLVNFSSTLFAVLVTLLLLTQT